MSASRPFTFTNVRILFPAVVNPKTKYGGKGTEYGMTILIPKKDTAQIDRLRAQYKELTAAEGISPRPFDGGSEKAVIKDGDTKYKNAQVDKQGMYEAFQGHWYIALSVDSTKSRIEAVDENRQPIITEAQIPHGAYGHVVVETSAYRSKTFGPQFSVKPCVVQVIDAQHPLGIVGMSPEAAISLLPGSDENQAIDDIF